MMAPLILLVSLLTLEVYAEREHRVHNIVLYPEKHSWCQTTPIKQIVAMAGYEPVTIDNNVCVGACYSYSIPRTQPAEPGELIGPYCDSCQPSETQCYHVTLQSDDGSKTAQKRVQIITNCSCASCNKEQINDCEIADRNTLELPTNLFSHLHQTSNESGDDAEVPELLNLSPPKNPITETVVLAENATNEQRHELNTKLFNLLRSIYNEENDDEESNFNYDKKELKELLEVIDGSEQELSYKNLVDLVKFVNVHNSENLELDLSKLSEVIKNFKKKQLDEKLNLHDVGQKNNAKIEEDIDALGKQYSVSKNFGIEGSHLSMSHHKGAHIGMGIVDAKSKMDAVKSPHNEIDPGHHKLEGSRGHHHVGEVQHLGVKLGHLIHGPHGSLVVAPDSPDVEEKLNLDSGDVRPNHEGTVISYENHHHHHGHHKKPPGF